MFAALLCQSSTTFRPSLLVLHNGFCAPRTNCVGAMKHRFWLFKRRGFFYVEDSVTGKQETLGTRDRKEAERLRDIKDEAASRPYVNLAIGKAYLEPVMNF